MDEESVKAATEKSRKKGYLDGAQLAEVFAWLRPNDLVWNYWVNNYLQGKPPPNFDILFWNADTTRMSAALHRDFIDIAHRQRADRAGQGDDARHAGRPVHGDRRLLRHRRASPTTSARGRPATAPPSCSAGRAGSSCRPAATSPRWSTRRATRSRPSRSPGSTPADPEEWLRAGRDGAGLLVAGLHDLAGRALRRRDPGADRRSAGRWRSWRRRAGHLCLRQVGPPPLAPAAGSTSGR